jgi:predicted Zn-dependent protease
MLSQAEALRLLERLLELSAAEQTELVLEHEVQNLTRFANSAINQNVSRNDAVLYVRAINDKRIGICSAKAFAGEETEQAIHKAQELSTQQPPTEDFVSLPGEQTAQRMQTYYDETAGFSPMERASGLKAALHDTTVSYSGAFETSARLLCVANSLGVRHVVRSTGASFSVTAAADEESSGWAQENSRNVTDLDIGEASRIAAHKALQSRNAIELEPGEYTVLLEEAAVATFLLFLSFLGFGARGFLQGRSFMSRTIGQKITGANITIVEDPFHPLSDGLPFDYEGVPKKRVVLIEDGFARGVVYDSLHAALGNTDSTGHALRPGNTYGPYPRNMFLKPGTKNKEELLAGIDRGVLITRFWYTNFKNPRNTEVTGLTRDGTFLIENGKITAGVKPARYSQSILEALSNCELSNTPKLRHQYGSSMVVPAARIDGFHFD